MKITASALPLLTNCPGPAHPSTWLEKDKTGPSAKFGNCIHLLAECHIKGKPIPVDEAMRVSEVDADERGRVERTWENLIEWLNNSADVEFMPEHPLLSEVPMALNVHTGEARRLDISGKREYGVDLPWVCGTADIVKLFDGKVIVYDIKTGNSRSDSYTAQLAMLCSAAMRIWNKPAASGYVLRAGEVECEYEPVIDLSLDDSNQHLLTLRDIVSKQSLIEPTYKAGPHCSEYYCRARKKCPAYQDFKQVKVFL